MADLSFLSANGRPGNQGRLEMCSSSTPGKSYKRKYLDGQLGQCMCRVTVCMYVYVGMCVFV